jgi:hypothetical protein
MEHRIKKRALSDVVTTVLIILVAIVAVGIIGVVVNKFVHQGVDQINTATQCNALVLTPVSCKGTTGTPTVVYNRGSGAVSLTGVKLIVTYDDGTSGVEPAATPVAGELESKSQAVTIAVPATKAAKSFAVAGVVTASDGSTQNCQPSQPVACVA